MIVTESIEQRVCAAVARIGEIEPGHPALDHMLTTIERPIGVVDDVQVHVGILWHFCGRVVEDESVEIRLSKVHVERFTRIDRRARRGGGVTSAEDDPLIGAHAIQESTRRKELEMARPRSETTTQGVELSEVSWRV
jgi:hypothetical protein